VREGWYDEEYLILFAEAEVPASSESYGIRDALPGFSVIGLRGWDDFIVRDPNGGIFSLPTVPLDAKYLASFDMPTEESILEQDSRFAGKIKWYVTPVVFGGDPAIGENLIWISHERHARLVRWWNAMYWRVTGRRNL